jgi:hypothetical protein
MVYSLQNFSFRNSIRYKNNKGNLKKIDLPLFKNDTCVLIGVIAGFELRISERNLKDFLKYKEEINTFISYFV